MNYAHNASDWITHLYRKNQFIAVSFYDLDR